MKRLASALAVSVILMSLFTTPATAVEVPSVTVTPVIEAPAVVLSFDKVTVTTEAAPAPEPEYIEPVYVEPVPVAPVPEPVYVQTPVPPHGEPAPPVCQEDEPCWDCKTMGNRICGNTLPTEAATRPDHPVMPYGCPADFWLFGDTCVNPTTGQPV